MNDCPDTGEHPRADCAAYGCDNFLVEVEELVPWGTSKQGAKDWFE